MFEAEEIVYALSRQLSWTHLRSLIYIADALKPPFKSCANASVASSWAGSSRSGKITAGQPRGVMDEAGVFTGALLHIGQVAYQRAAIAYGYQ